MATYQIKWKTSALRELKKIDRKMIPRIVSLAESLVDNPFPSGTRKLCGADKTYRIRVGDYRILYDVHQSIVTIEIIRVKHRKDVYRN
jgi:mRNA interferase RelE/StbE